MQKRLIGVKELAEYLDVSPGIIYSWTHMKRIPYYKLGQLVKFDLDKVEQWLKKKEVKVHWLWKEMT